MNNGLCKCGAKLIAPAGNLGSKVLIVGDLPDFEDIRNGRCMTGRTAEIIKHELALIGMSLNDVCFTNFWTHYKGKDCSEDVQMDRFLQIAKGRTHILLLGSETTKILFKKNAIDLSGIEMKHELFKNTRIMVTIGLSAVSKDDLGEFRIALERFKKMLKEKK